ncbi:MAG: hypothetical protein C4288_22610 [Leptolyngbya sp. ERB_1_1]
MQVSTQKMQRYVLAWVGLFVAFAATYPIAMMRVSQTQKFTGQAFNSQTCETKPQSGSRAVVSWLETCRNLSMNP